MYLRPVDSVIIILAPRALFCGRNRSGFSGGASPVAPVGCTYSSSPLPSIHLSPVLASCSAKVRGPGWVSTKALSCSKSPFMICPANVTCASIRAHTHVCLCVCMYVCVCVGVSLRCGSRAGCHEFLTPLTYFCAFPQLAPCERSGSKCQPFQSQSPHSSSASSPLPPSISTVSQHRCGLTRSRR